MALHFARYFLYPSDSSRDYVWHAENIELFGQQPDLRCLSSAFGTF